MNIQVNIRSIDGDCYGLYQLTRMYKHNRNWSIGQYPDIQDEEICWRFISFCTDNPYPTIYIDDEDRSYIKFKPEHLNGN